jgi:hypothetical protein
MASPPHALSNYDKFVVIGERLSPGYDFEKFVVTELSELLHVFRNVLNRRSIGKRIDERFEVRLNQRAFTYAGLPVYWIIPRYRPGSSWHLSNFYGSSTH